MKIYQKENDLIIEDVCDFSISQILECGQCFHFKRLAEDDYVLVHREKLLHISQQNNRVIFHNTDMADYEKVWKDYFDIDRDYNCIKAAILKKDTKLKDAIDKMWGVRILNQDFFETLISFIISQNKQIPHIKQIVFALSERYGKPLGTVNGEVYYSFPDAAVLANVSEEEYRELKVGFRAPYIFDAVRRVREGCLTEQDLKQGQENVCRDKLKEIKGVGDKVANCVMLFSLGYRSSFPVDVWIKRIMEETYFEKEEKPDVIERFGKQLFGEYGGYAQQYLFYYGRESEKVRKSKKSKKNN